MRLASKPLGFVLNFLLGVSWAVALLGGVGSFLSFYHTHLLYAVASAFVGVIPGLVGVLLIEHIVTSEEKLLELRKQTRLLERIASNLENRSKS